MEIEIVIAAVILLALSFLATIDMAFSQISDVGLRRIAVESDESESNTTAEFLREILENRPRFRFALSATIQILLIVFTVLTTAIVFQYFQILWEQIVYALLVAVVLTIVFRQILPRLLTDKNTEGKLLVLLPLVRPLYRVESFFARLFGGKSKTRETQKLEATQTPDAPEEKEEDHTEDFQALMEVGEAEGIIVGKERELIETMVEFSVTKAGEIMTPRTDICALPLSSTVHAARDLIIGEKYSRLPVYRDTIDNIEGVIYVRDLLNAWAEGKENQTIAGLLRPAYFVPETKSAAELLKNMQSTHVQVAIVVDEYGGVAGLVTIEDIVEEIVGEIEDEDIEEEEIIEIIEGAEGYFDVLGSTEIGKIERLFDMEIEDDDFTTIAGLVTSEVGYVPKPSEKLSLRGLNIEVLRADEKRIQLLRLRRATGEETEMEEIIDEI